MATKTSAAQPPGSRIARSPNVTCTMHATGITLVGNGARHGERLDPFGSHVWQLLADEPTLPILVERLRDDRTRVEQLAEDVVRLLARWHGGDMIAWR
ncbi:MAG: hypothetical protein JWM95_4861 [Gemmatimonadetes bacterium]|nr:hypothetical protein [Gemmatimonadota bacterium]